MKPLKNDIMYILDFNLYIKGDIRLNINIKIGVFIKENYMEILFQKKLESYYYMHDKSVEIEVYYNSDESIYVSLWQVFNFNDFTLQIILVFKTEHVASFILYSF